jgi:aminoglycoside N3'-acetyltransferase
VNLFKDRNGIVTADQFSQQLEALQLNGKNVIVYSRLLSLGRFLGKEAVSEFLNILKKHVGAEGTLSIPTYTLNSYKEPRLFDNRKSKIMSGVLGDIAATDPDFKRTIHPVYSNCVYGKHTQDLMAQDATTCFGNQSFFELFSQIENSYVMMIGLNFNGPTLYHYYDQKYNAPGRIVKDFYIRMNVDEHSFGMHFNSYVKDYTFYDNKMNCLAKFDALAESFGFTDRIAVGDDFIHGITEKRFQSLYQAALEVGQEYFLLSSNDDWEEYFMKNNFRFLHNTVEESMIGKVKGHASFPD